jgi:hypothetical protein
MNEQSKSMGLVQRLKSWLRSDPSEQATATGTAVAGYVRRVHAEVEITSSNVPRPLAVLMPPALAAATPLRTIPLFLVPSASGLAEADVEIFEPTPVPPLLLLPVLVQPERPATKLQLVYNADAVQLIQPALAKPAQPTFLLAARLASVAQLNTVVGKVPVKPQTRIVGPTDAKNRAKMANRPTATLAETLPTPKRAATSSRGVAGSQCFVRTQTSGKSTVTAVPQRAKRRAA